MRPARAISGHVFRVDGRGRSVWRAKYRVPDGRQVQRTIGPVSTERGPPEGYFTKRTAQASLRDVLHRAERGVLPGMVRTGRTFADAADEYLRYLAEERQRKPSTVRDANSVIRNHLRPPFGPRRLEDITEEEVERWARRLGGHRPLSNATKRKVIVMFNGVMARARRVYGLPVNPVARIEKPRLAAPGAIDVLSPEEVQALVRAATSEQDAAIFLTAEFTGLRQGELVALWWHPRHRELYER
jgi:integrase